MVKYSLKLYANGTATADAVANVIVPANAAIILVSWSLDGTCVGAVGFSEIFQLGIQSTGQFATNDSRNVIDEAVIGGDGAITAANNNVIVNKITPVGGWALKAGDRIYLHRFAVTVASALRANVTVHLA